MNRQTINQVIQAGPFSPDDRSLQHIRCPQWYRDGKFGIFIHWGVYSVPAFGSEWYPRNMYTQGSLEYEHHRKTYGPQDKFGYKDFIPAFTMKDFAPADWAKLFVESGARFVVPVAEHHDGFAMYDSSLNVYNAKAMGPCRDAVGELGKAVTDAGLTLGLSSHRAEHYWFFGKGLAFDSDVRDAANAAFYGVSGQLPVELDGSECHKFHHARPSTEVVEDWLLNTCDFVQKYRPKLVWFDWWINNFGYRQALREFAAFYYNCCHMWGIEGAINYKYQAYSPDAAIFDIERGQLDAVYPQFWQNDTSVSKNSWGYIVNQQYKKAAEIIADLADIVSKNGALLLNIGPRADGTIPEAEQTLLRQIGGWLNVNGEAIYDTRPYLVYGEGPTKVAAGSFTDTNRQGFTSGDMRYTAKGDCVYLIMLAAGSDHMLKSHALALDANSAPAEILSAELLGHGPVPFARDTDSLRVTLPGTVAAGEPGVVKFIVRY